MTLLSQNATFVLACEETEADAWPLGGAVVQSLHARLVARGWVLDEIDTMDGCWGYSCRRGGGQLSLVFAPHPPAWFVRISALSAPGWIGRLRGHQPSAIPDEMYELAQEVHEAVVADGGDDVRWCWDGPPDDHSPQQQPPPGDGQPRPR